MHTFCVSAANVHFQGCRAPLSDSSFGPDCMRTTCSCKVSFPRRRGLVCLGNKFSTRHSISPVKDQRALAQACGDFSLLLCACVCVSPPPSEPPRPPPPPPPSCSCVELCCARLCPALWSKLIMGCIYVCSQIRASCIIGFGLLTYWAWGQYWSTHVLGLGSVLVYSHTGLGISTGLLS